MTRRAKLDAELPPHVLSKIEVGPDCWKWLGHSNTGYGRVEIAGRSRYAHRVVYESTVRPVPNGLTLDHLCKNRLCVNPDHLEIVTQAENNLRADSNPSTINAHKVECVNGHPFDAGNTYIAKTGRRACRECNRIRKAMRLNARSVDLP